MAGNTKTEVVRAAAAFAGPGRVLDSTSYGTGHIHDTYLIRVQTEDPKQAQMVLQRINPIVFPQPAALMENTVRITSYLRGQIRARGGDEEREVLHVLCTRDDCPYYQDDQGAYWRAFRFVTGATSYDRPRGPTDFYEGAKAFGDFTCLLADFPVDSLHEIMPGFHDTARRFADLQEAVQADRMGRAASARAEIELAVRMRRLARFFGDLLKEGGLSLRVTHNDTKFNNILLDDRTGKGLCVMDLDTVMPGLIMYDFGDAVRFGANRAAHEGDLQGVALDLSLYEACTKGFVDGCGESLSAREIRLFPMGAKAMTYECGIRFLTDYLNGDAYFRTDYPRQNLDRCCAQFRLMTDMSRKWDSMQEITEKYV